MDVCLNYVRVSLECRSCGSEQDIFYDPNAAHSTITIGCTCGTSVTWDQINGARPTEVEL